MGARFERRIIMNKNVVTAIANFENAMTEVRTIIDFEEALDNYFSTCFMQNMNSGYWNVRGAQMYHIASKEGGFLTFGYESDNGTRTFTLEGSEVIDMIIHESEIKAMISLMKEDEQYFIRDVVYTFIETLEHYLRKEEK